MNILNISWKSLILKISIFKSKMQNNYSKFSEFYTELQSNLMDNTKCIQK